MKRLNYILLILGLIVLSCNKPPEVLQVQDVIFKATTNSTGLKSTCDNPLANFALIEIDGTTQQVGIFYLNDQIFTNTIKLAPGDHEIGMFTLVNDGGSPDTPAGDIIVQAAPLDGYNFANFVSNPLPYKFTINAFIKAEVDIELLCFKPTDYDNFGFTWFSVDEITVREFCFFGDFCTVDYLCYAGSLYEQQNNGDGLRHDMPAIFKIDVVRNGDTIISYNNEEWLGEGSPLCVQYPDYKNTIDNFQFILSILVRENDAFVYKQFYIWTTTDDGVLENIGTDNVMDFVLGDCVPTADLILPSYTNSCDLPPPPPPTECADCKGKVSALTLEYIGTQSNPYILIEDKDNNVLFQGNVSGAFDFIGVDTNNEMTNEIEIFVNGTSNVKIHTSCSKDIFTGMAFGDFKIISGASSEGGNICSISETPTPIFNNETAFAYDKDKDRCFTRDDFSNWGWTNGYYEIGRTYSNEIKLIAGAGGCDITKGVEVGTLSFSSVKTTSDYEGTVTVTYNLYAGFSLGVVQLYVGDNKYPENGNDPTVAPGQYTVKAENLPNGTTTYTFTVNISTTDKKFHFIAHADVSSN